MVAKKYHWLIGLVVAAVVAAAVMVVFLYSQGIIGNPDRQLYNTVKNKPEVLAMYKAAEEAQKKIALAPDKPGLYLDAGLEWKGLGDMLQDKRFLVKSLAIYEDGAERFGESNILFYLNAGKVAESMGEFEKAEKYYRRASAISPLDETPYMYLADLFVYKLKKSKNEILAVFAEAEVVVGDRFSIVWARGSYLRDVGDYAGALKDYEILVKSFPDRTGYKQIVAELKAKLKAAK